MARWKRKKRGKTTTDLNKEKRTRILCIVSHPLATAMIILMATVAMVTVAGTGGSAESEGSKISGFVIGHVWYDPFKILFMQDPLFTYSLYPLPSDIPYSDKRKLDRVYYPRTREILIDSYDLMVFHDARFMHFTSRQIHDLDYAFREAGMISMLNMRGSFMWDWVWEVTILHNVAPISYHDNNRYVGHRVVFRRERDPVFLPFLELGIEKVMGNAVAEMDSKQGSTVWADAKPQNQPWLVSWKPGENAGMQWVNNQCQDWWIEKNNPYILDVATNMVLYSMDRPLISDILPRREARRLFASLQAQKSLTLSVMEWADTFGANILSLSERLKDLEDGMEDAISDYLDQDYTATILFLESMRPKISEISDDAVRLKDEALFWVYAVEWLVVTSAGIISGVVVWSLMVRRRMYRTVETTRLGPRVGLSSLEKEH